MTDIYNINIRSLPLEFSDYPRLQEVFDVWEGWRSDRQAPVWKDVELVRLPSALIPQTVVCDVVDNGNDYRFRFWGTGSSALFKQECTNKLLSEFGWSNELMEKTKEQFECVLQSKKPILNFATFKKQSGTIADKVTLRLPIMDTPGEVTKIISTHEFFDRGIDTEDKLDTVKREVK